MEFTVNAPLRLDGANVYLLGHGYAPVLRYTDRFDRAQSVTAPFLPVDQLGTAEGVATFPDANVDPEAEQRERALQVAFDGLYLPSATADAPVLFGSAHPAERAPLLWLRAWRGDLGIDTGRPQSVYALNPQQVATGQLRQAGEPAFLRPGETMTLDDGTSVEFVGTRRWITISVRHDPGEPVVLAGAVGLLAGLVPSLVGRRRRVWLRIADAGHGSSRVEAGGLPRSDYPGFADEFGRLLDGLPLHTSPANTSPEPATRST